MLRFLFVQRLRQAKRYVSRADLGRIVTVLLLVVVGLGVAFGVYGLLVAGLSEVAGNEFLRVALPFFVYEIFLLVVSGLVFFSVLIAGVFALFRSSQDALVVASPSSSQLIYDKFSRVSSLSSWPLLVIAVPALLAVYAVFSIGVGGLLLSLIAVVLLAFVSAGLAFCLLLTLSFLVRAICQQIGIGSQFRLFVMSVGISVVVLAGGLWLQFSGIDIATLFSVSNLQLAEANIKEITGLFEFFPSHLAALVLQSVQTNALLSAFMSLIGLAGLSLASFLTMVYLSRGYIASWRSYQSNRIQSGNHKKEGRIKSKQDVVFSNSAVVSLIKKEGLAFLRNAHNQLWALFLLLLWVMTVAFDSFMRSEITNEFFFGIPALEFIQVFQLLVVVYFVAALSVRFVFPSFSLEKEQAWSLLSAPVSLVRLFWAKALFFSSVLVVVSAVIASIHTLLLGMTGMQALLFVMLSIVATATVTLMGLSLGARFPNFQTTNPDVLATTLPGLSFVLLSLIYGSVASLTLYHVFLTDQFQMIGYFAAGSILIVALFSYMAVRNLPTIEFEAEF